MMVGVGSRGGSSHHDSQGRERERKKEQERGWKE
jgi:hypothetical protein